MKAFKVLVVLGGILLILGIIVALGAQTSLSRDSTFSIPSGSGYYYVYTLSGMFTGEQVTFSYSVVSSGTVDVYFLTAAAYSTYSFDLTVPSSLYANPGAIAGSGTVSIPADGTYYLVVNHGSGYSGFAQSGGMTIGASGLNVTVLGIGIGLAIVGIALLAVGYRMRSKAQPVPRGYVPPSQVTMFPPSGQGLPPSPPPQPPQPPQNPWPPNGPPPPG